MSKLKYILLAAFISFGISAHAQNTPPELEVPGDSQDDVTADPLLEPANTGAKTVKQPELPKLPVAEPMKAAGEESPEKKKILDRAITDVFKEPAKNTEAKPAEISDKVTITVKGDNTDAPKVAEDAAPLAPVPNNEVIAPAVPKIPETAPVAPMAEDTKPIKPLAAAPSETKAEPISEPVELKQTEVNSSAEKPLENKEVAKPKVKKVFKPKPKKKIVIPEAPKSLRMDYPEQGSGAAPTMPAQQNISVQQPMQFNNVPAVPVQPINTFPVSPVYPMKQQAFPHSFKQSSIEDDSFDALPELPVKKKEFEVKNNIEIEKAEFKNPFGSKKKPSSNEALSEIDDNPELDSSSTPVVDFSNNESIDDLAKNDSAATTANESFYMQESGLDMELKSPPANSLDAMQNAYDALQVGQYESAIKYYNSVLKTEPTNIKALFGVATAYHMSKDYDNAKATYLKIIKQDPKYLPAVNNYIVLVTEENPERSIPKLEELYARNPEFAAIPAQLGNLYYKKNELQKSVEYYVAAVKLEPDNVDYRYNLAVILEKTSRHEEAAMLYKSLLDDAAKGVAMPEDPNFIRERFQEMSSK